MSYRHIRAQGYKSRSYLNVDRQDILEYDKRRDDKLLYTYCFFQMNRVKFK